MVGATSAYAIMMRKAASDIVLIDANLKRAEAEAQDIQHAVPFVHATDVYAGGYDDLADAKIVVIAAGASQKARGNKAYADGKKCCNNEGYNF